MNLYIMLEVCVHEFSCTNKVMLRFEWANVVMRSEIMRSVNCDKMLVINCIK